MSEENVDLTNLADKRIFTTGEAAVLCKVSQQTIIRCFDAGRLNGFRVPGSKFRRIPREELIRFMRSNEIPTDALESPRKRVLVVDDDPQIIELFVDMLSRDPRLEVRTATTGFDAGALTESFKPHLVLLDYLLPDINGNMVCRRLRANKNLDSIKILCVSGVIDQSEVKNLKEAGADDFIKKPFDLGHMVRRISELLGIEPAASLIGQSAPSRTS
jgi:hypothetical protein